MKNNFINFEGHFLNYRDRTIEKVFPKLSATHNDIMIFGMRLVGMRLLF